VLPLDFFPKEEATFSCLNHVHKSHPYPYNKDRDAYAKREHRLGIL